MVSAMKPETEFREGELVPSIAGEQAISIDGTDDHRNRVLARAR
jgi:hypothetical protein